MNLIHCIAFKIFILPPQSENYFTIVETQLIPQDYRVTFPFAQTLFRLTKDNANIAVVYSKSVCFATSISCV